MYRFTVTGYVSQEDGSMPCDRPVNVLLYLLFYYCAKLHLLLGPTMPLTNKVSSSSSSSSSSALGTE